MIGQSFFAEHYKFLNYVELSAKQHQQILKLNLLTQKVQFYLPLVMNIKN